MAVNNDQLSIKANQLVGQTAPVVISSSGTKVSEKIQIKSTAGVELSIDKGMGQDSQIQ